MSERRDIYGSTGAGDGLAGSGMSGAPLWADAGQSGRDFNDGFDAGRSSSDPRKEAAARAMRTADLRALSRMGSGGSGGSNFSRAADRALMLALFAVVVLALLGLLALGTNAYRTLAEDRDDAAALRQESGLLLNTVRANDTADAVEEGVGPEGPSLVLVERLDSGTFETRLYAYQGFIMEEYVVAGAEYDPASATRVAESQTFEFSYDGASGLLTLVTDAGEARIALRCGGGASDAGSSADGAFSMEAGAGVAYADAGEGDDSVAAFNLDDNSVAVSVGPAGNPAAALAPGPGGGEGASDE